MIQPVELIFTDGLPSGNLINWNKFYFLLNLPSNSWSFCHKFTKLHSQKFFPGVKSFPLFSRPCFSFYKNFNNSAWSIVLVNLFINSLLKVSEKQFPGWSQNHFHYLLFGKIEKQNLTSHFYNVIQHFLKLEHSQDWNVKTNLPQGCLSYREAM